MRDEAVIALLVVLVMASAGAGYFVGYNGLKPDDVQVRGSVSLFSDNKCCLTPTYVTFFFVICQPAISAGCTSSYNAALSQPNSIGYNYTVTVPNGHQYTINPGVRFSNGTEIGCTANIIPVYSYSQTLDYDIASSCP